MNKSRAPACPEVELTPNASPPLQFVPLPDLDHLADILEPLAEVPNPFSTLLDPLAQPLDLPPLGVELAKGGDIFADIAFQLSGLALEMLAQPCRGGRELLQRRERRLQLRQGRQDRVVRRVELLDGRVGIARERAQALGDGAGSGEDVSLGGAGREGRRWSNRMGSANSLFLELSLLPEFHQAGFIQRGILLL